MLQQLVGIGFFSFFMLGIIQAMYGPALPAMQKQFGVSSGVASLMVTMQFLGAAVGTLGYIPISTKLSTRDMLLWCLGLFTAGTLILALSPIWWLVLAGLAIMGVGYGMLATTLNTSIASYGEKAASQLNFTNAMFGVGSIVGPFLVVRYLQHPQSAFLWILLLMIPAVWLTLKLSNSQQKGSAFSFKRPEKGWGFLASVILMYFMYVATEVSIASWETTLLRKSMAEAMATAAPAYFWGGLTVGRLLNVLLTRRFSPRRIVTTTTICALLCLFLAHIPGFTLYAYVMAGFFFSPIFPTGLAWLGQVAKEESRWLIPLASMVAALGGALMPALVGVWVDHSGVEVIPTAIVIYGSFILLGVLLLGYFAHKK